MRLLNPIVAAVAGLAVAGVWATSASARPVPRLVQVIQGALAVQQGSGPAVSGSPTGSHVPSAPDDRSLSTFLNGVRAASSGRRAAMARVSSVDGDRVTIAMDDGTSATLSVDAASAERLRGMLGKRVVVTARSDDALVVTPAFQALAGSVVSIDGRRLTVRTTEGSLVPIVLPATSAAFELRKGSFLSALSDDGGATFTAYVPRAGRERDVPYVGRVVGRAASSIQFLTADGLTHTFSCGTCTARIVDGARRHANAVVSADVSPLGRIVRLAPLGAGTRLGGILAGTDGQTLALLTANGALLMLACSCNGLSLASGTAVVADLDAQGVVSLSPSPAPSSPPRTHDGNCRKGTACAARASQAPAGVWPPAGISSDTIASNCSLSSGTVIDARVQDAGTSLPVYHARVELAGRFGTTWLTSQDGAVEFEGAPPGTYRIVASKRGFAPATTRAFVVGCHQGFRAQFALSRTPGTQLDPSIARVRPARSRRERTAARCWFEADRASSGRPRFVCSGRP